jgi:hypothetical protein
MKIILYDSFLLVDTAFHNPNINKKATIKDLNGMRFFSSFGPQKSHQDLNQ